MLHFLLETFISVEICYRKSSIFYRRSMKSVSALIGLVALCVTSCGGALNNASPLSPQRLVSHTGSATVALVHTDYDNDDSEVSDTRPLCSAVWIDKTHILTAYHCAVGVQEELQERQDKREKDTPPCEGLAAALHLCSDEAVEHKVIEMKDLPVHFVQWKEADEVGKEPTAQHLSHVVGWDEAHDLALLEAAGHAIPSHESAELALAVPGMGEPVSVCGHPKGFYWTFLNGTVAGYRMSLPHMSEHKDKVKSLGPYLQLEIPIYFGNSGGGAFNSAGQLIGIADFLTKLPAEGFFIPVDPIRTFLIDNDVLPGKKTKKVEEVKPVVAPVINIIIQAAPIVIPVVPDAVVPPTTAGKADVIPAPPLVIPHTVVPPGIGVLPPLGVTPKP
jgi:hypothetical protein